MDLYNKQFEQRQETSAYWHNKSHDLLVSARTLWNAMESERKLETNCWATYKMLMGMSFELLFKAHCVGSGTEFKSTHDLVALANIANLPISKEEKKLLKVLSEYVIWDGRYPTPKKPEHLKGHWKNQADLLDDKLDLENLMPLWRQFSDSFMEHYN
ncbi:HEPN domain-containing protein [Thalassotalea sp. 1_MG-2023]|uniref:HEPN domain-containing protein n=1 Tax=Thalassotalea sp. 1_MG-2023 TaxID=3062680 RepID=UPI0026E1B915|nr:HEPN domain-containing protein [Thalassotalea sp. 1_MG-2023]MDO6427134.1 HEPN domain-containing protein [Thalassotalea sp. 1_MG-2023]